MLELGEPGAYAGIGSRSSPADVLDLMGQIATKLGCMGWRLRSGGASGADSAFERRAFGADIFLPWPGFNDRRDGALNSPSPRAFEIAAWFHPGWAHLGRGSQALHARNVHQVLGADCKSPAAFVLCWTPDGAVEKTTSKTGGTGQAIRIANAYGVRVWNLQREEHRREWSEWIGESQLHGGQSSGV